MRKALFGQRLDRSVSALPSERHSTAADLLPSAAFYPTLFYATDQSLPE